VAESDTSSACARVLQLSPLLNFFIPFPPFPSSVPPCEAANLATPPAYFSFRPRCSAVNSINGRFALYQYSTICSCALCYRRARFGLQSLAELMMAYNSAVPPAFSGWLAVRGPCRPRPAQGEHPARNRGHMGQCRRVFSTNGARVAVKAGSVRAHARTPRHGHGFADGAVFSRAVRQRCIYAL
jgi:hypothetical protein